MALRGVRSSWLTAVRNRVLAALAFSADFGHPGQPLGGRDAGADVARLREDQRRAGGAGDGDEVDVQMHELLVLRVRVEVVHAQFERGGLLALADAVDGLHEEEPVGDVDVLVEAAPQRLAQPLAAGCRVEAVDLEDVALQVVQRHEARQAVEGNVHRLRFGLLGRLRPGAAALDRDRQARQGIGRADGKRQPGGEGDARSRRGGSGDEHGQAASGDTGR